MGPPLAPKYPKYPYGLIFRYKINFFLRGPPLPLKLLGSSNYQKILSDTWKSAKE